MDSYDGLSYERKPLSAMFRPRSVAVIGATERAGSLGRTAMWNLMNNPFGGVIYPINPKRSNVLGIKAYPALSDIPDSAPLDLAIIAVPAEAVPTAVEQCAAHHVKGAVIISAGFQDTEAQAQLRQALGDSDMRLIGPNSWGIMVPRTGLNASVARGMAHAGSVGFISQSGALCSAILDWSFRENVGFSAFVSVGSMLDVNWADLIYMLGDDPRTKSIVMYMETIGDARAFMSAAREVALSKPIIVIKPGQTAEAARAVSFHTGTLTQADEVITAAFRRCGVLRVSQLSDLFHMAETLGKQPRPISNKLTIITNAGGPGVLATDALILGGGQLTQLAQDTQTALNDLFGADWSRANPIDLHSGATRETFKQAIEVALHDHGSNGLLVILTPQGLSDPTGTAEELAQLKKQTSKPILAAWMGGENVAAGVERLNQANIPTFDYPDTAARMFNYLWRYYRNIQSLYETPQLPDDTPEELAAHGYASSLLAEIRETGRTLLTEYESKLVLAAYNIPTVDTRLVQSAEEAV
ncbi:MAG: CoA-binding protein, partial [Anaerolineales bacterium]|nr:CoA-binding protein [Anaerolineales bacterium]